MDRILGKFMPIPHAEGCSSWYSNRTQKGQFFSEIPSRSLLQSEIPLELIGQYYDNGSLSPVDHHYSLVLIPESGLSKGVRRSPQWGHAQSSWGHSTSTALELQSTSTRLNNGHKLSSPKKKNMIYAVHECPGPAGPDKPSHTCAVMCLFHLFLGHGSPPGWDPLATKNWLFLLDTDHCQCCFIPQIRWLIIIFLKCTKNSCAYGTSWISLRNL